MSIARDIMGGLSALIGLAMSYYLFGDQVHGFADMAIAAGADPQRFVILLYFWDICIPLLCIFLLLYIIIVPFRREYDSYYR